MDGNALRENLRRLLDVTGKSARQVSREAGLSESAVKHILNGNSQSPRYENVVAIAKALGVSVRELTGSTSRPTPALAQLPETLVQDQAKLRLLRYWDALSDEGRAVLLQQIMDSVLSD